MNLPQDSECITLLSTSSPMPRLSLSAEKLRRPTDGLLKASSATACSVVTYQFNHFVKRAENIRSNSIKVFPLVT